MLVDDVPEINGWVDPLAHPPADRQPALQRREVLGRSARGARATFVPTATHAEIDVTDFGRGVREQDRGALFQALQQA
jgi:hypothetical protein